VSRVRRRPDPSRASRDRWLLSYADFITLLFALFATLYASSTVDANKLATVAQGLQHAFDLPTERRPGISAARNGVLPAGRGVVGDGELDARTEILRELSEDLRLGRLELSEDARGMVLSIPEASAFPTATADLSPLAQGAVTRLAAVLTRLPNAVRVEGHTDDVPIHTARFTSNWELSTARAIRVVELLIEQGQLAPDRLSAAGYGEYHPRVANESAAARAQNRRVDVVILSPSTRAAEEPAASRIQPGRRPAD
jgi:chemotaxis protein MotB